jgi:hypothetical protein|tara:strand:- start:820 stop:1062 length:243 start_codon:yes stop_codon:yes gene_type:complete
MSEENNDRFYMDSFTKGRPMPLLVSDYPTLADVLSAENISINNVVIQFKDSNNNDKPVELNTPITVGDSINIANAANKSG